MGKYRKKPIIIEAVQLTWDNWSEICDFADVGELKNGRPEGAQVGESIALDIPTLEGTMRANENDWIIKDVAGEIYPCKPDIFKQTYEEIEN